MALYGFVAVPFFVIAFPALVKRLHDFDRPGILAVVYLLAIAISLMCDWLSIITIGYKLGIIIKVINAAVGLALALISGTRGPNKYGKKTHFVFHK